MSLNPNTKRARIPFLACSGLLLLAVVESGCGGEPARKPNPTRPLDERRATEVIVRTFRSENLPAIRRQQMPIPGDKTLEIDVGAEGKKYGVAFVTAGERTALGAALPQVAPGDEHALQLVRGDGDYTEARVLVLHDTMYLYDDQVGTEREASTISAENKLQRDVRDFLVRARAEKWP